MRKLLLSVALIAGIMGSGNSLTAQTTDTVTTNVVASACALVIFDGGKSGLPKQFQNNSTCQWEYGRLYPAYQEISVEQQNLADALCVDVRAESDSVRTITAGSCKEDPTSLRMGLGMVYAPYDWDDFLPDWVDHYRERWPQSCMIDYLFKDVDGKLILTKVLFITTLDSQYGRRCVPILIGGSTT